MENNEAVALLREIRDLQKAHLEKYEIYLGKHEKLQRRAILISLIVLIVFLGLLYLPSIWH